MVSSLFIDLSKHHPSKNLEECHELSQYFLEKYCLRNLSACVGNRNHIGNSIQLRYPPFVLNLDVFDIIKFIKHFQEYHFYN